MSHTYKNGQVAADRKEDNNNGNIGSGQDAATVPAREILKQVIERFEDLSINEVDDRERKVTLVEAKHTCTLSLPDTKCDNETVQQKISDGSEADSMLSTKQSDVTGGSVIMPL